MDYLVDQHGHYRYKQSEDDKVQAYLIEELLPAHLCDDLVAFVQALVDIGIVVRHVLNDVPLVPQSLVGLAHILICFLSNLLDVSELVFLIVESLLVAEQLLPQLSAVGVACTSVEVLARVIV